jgi:dephospho-CoA kinase
MRDLSLHILKLLHKETFCEEWIQTKYKQKPIFIQGNPGCGKSSLAKYILRDRTIVCIHSDITKETSNLKQYLRDNLYKKNVTMLFSHSLKDKLPKALLFDDMDTIRGLNKSFFQECIQFSKKKNTGHPVIYVSSLLQGKDLQTLYNHSFPLSITIYKSNFTRK